MFNFFKSKSLDSILNQTRKVKISGVVFTIKKINVLDYLDGSKIIQQSYEIYKTGKIDQTPDVNEKKVKEFFSQFLVAGVVNPKLSLKDNGEGIFVERLFLDWDLCMKLYSEIMFFTYGKKKTKLNI